MLTSITYDPVKDEIQQLNTIIKDLAAELTDDIWNIEKADKIEELKRILEDKPLMDMLFFDTTDELSMGCLEKIRKDYPKTYLMLLADATVSPMKYLRPQIGAQSLLLRPFSKEQAIITLREFIGEYVKDYYDATENNEDVFVIDSVDEGRIVLPYNQIYYFEAMDKKVFVCTGVDEYGFYETLDALTDKLPSDFARCHRSFIVNKSKICRVALSLNTLFLYDEMEVPLSRSYKSDFKEVR